MRGVGKVAIVLGGTAPRGMGGGAASLQGTCCAGSGASGDGVAGPVTRGLAGDPAGDPCLSLRVPVCEELVTSSTLSGPCQMPFADLGAGVCDWLLRLLVQ